MADFDLSKLEMSGASGIDALFQREASMVTPTPGHKRRVASLRDLSAFTRVSAETLVHKSDRDLWAIKREANGGFSIERLFDDNGTPLKG
jgi:hypothetical protein